MSSFSIKNDINIIRLKQMIIRFFSSLSVFTVTVFFTPNFDISSFPILILASLFIISSDYLMSVISGIHDIPLGRGIIGFTAAAVFIYMAQFFVSGYNITLISSFIAAAIYGIISSMIPNKI